MILSIMPNFWDKIFQLLQKCGQNADKKDKIKTPND